MPWFEDSPTVERFRQALGHDGWLEPLDWQGWIQRPENRGLLDDPSGVARLDEADLQRLLTTIIRSDRFSDGSLAGAFERGYLQAITRRAAELAAPGSTDSPSMAP